MTSVSTSFSNVNPVVGVENKSFNLVNLVPQPQECRFYNDLPLISLPNELAFVSSLKSAKIEAYLRENLKAKNIKLLEASSSSKMEIRVTIDSSFHGKEQGYRLKVLPAKILISARDEEGLFYGIVTFLQIIEIYPKDRAEYQLAQMEIIDWPDFPNRGFFY